MILTRNFYPFLTEIILIKREYPQWVVLVDVVSLKLIQYDQNEQL